MIREATVGVAVKGKEGESAKGEADYWVEEVRMISKLVLWHGRVVGVGGAKMAMFIVERGMVIAIMQFGFIVMYFFTDVQLFNGILMLGYTTFFTTLPVISIVIYTLTL